MSDMPDTPPPQSLAAPPEGIYPTFEDLLNSVQRWAREQGYGVVKLRASNYRDGKPTRYDLVCDRGGVKYHSTAKKRNPSTRKIDCPWRAKAVCEVQLGYQWRFAVQESRHNHEARMPTVQTPVHPPLPLQHSQQQAKPQSQQEAQQSQPQQQQQQQQQPQQQQQQQQPPLPPPPQQQPQLPIQQHQPQLPIQQMRPQQAQQQQQHHHHLHHQHQQHPQQQPPPVVGSNVNLGQQNTVAVDANLARSLNMKLDRLAHDMSNSFMRIETALSNLDKRIDSLENRQFHHAPRFDGLESRVHNHEVRINNLETRGMELTMDDVETGRLLTHAMVEDIPAR